MLIADRAQLFEIALGRRQATETAGGGFDEDRRDVVAADHGADARKIVGQIGTGLGLAAHELVFGQRGMAHEMHPGQADAEASPVIDHPRERHAAHIDAVISALARDEELPVSLTADAVKGKRHLHGGIDRLRTGAHEKDPVHAGRREVGDALGQLEGLGLGTGEGHRVVERGELLVDRLGDLRAAMTRRDAKQTRRGIDHLIAIGLVEPHAFGPHEHARLLLELLVRRERHPVVLACIDFKQRIGVAHGMPPVKK